MNETYISKAKQAIESLLQLVVDEEDKREIIAQAIALRTHQIAEEHTGVCIDYLCDPVSEVQR